MCLLRHNLEKIVFYPVTLKMDTNMYKKDQFLFEEG